VNKLGNQLIVVAVRVILTAWNRAAAAGS